MKELLAVSWEMPPLTGPRATQVARTMVALADLGWRSRTVCFDPRSTRYQQDGDVSVEQASEGRATLIPVRSPEEWLGVRVLWRLVPPLKHFPDEKRVWIPGALRAARRALATTPVDALVTFAQPWSDHLIGLCVKREQGLPWVAHFSDPWVDSPYQRQGSTIARRAAAWERAIIQEADRVVFVNTYTRDRVMAKYPGAWHSKCAVVPQGHDGAVQSGAASARLGAPLRIVYTGRFYDGLRTPDAFLRALATVHHEQSLANRISVTFVGAAMDSYSVLADRLGVSQLVTFTGRVSPRAALQEAASANVLLVIDSAATDGPSLFLPSKLIDYLPLRRPIIGVTPAQGPTGDLLRELQYPVIRPGDEAGLAALLRTLGANPAHLVLSPRHDSVASRYHIAKTTAQFAAVLDDACAGR